jgi:hypothetical protein
LYSETSHLYDLTFTANLSGHMTEKRIQVVGRHDHWRTETPEYLKIFDIIVRMALDGDNLGKEP